MDQKHTPKNDNKQTLTKKKHALPWWGLARRTEMMCCHLPCNGHWWRRCWRRRCGGHGGWSDINNVAVGVMGEVEGVVRPIGFQLLWVNDAAGDHVSDGTFITRTPVQADRNWERHESEQGRMCVCVRERERGAESKREKSWKSPFPISCWQNQPHTHPKNV